jgi:hypothetical protein
MTLCAVDSTAARVALHRSARSRGYKLSREGTDPRSLWKGVCADLVRCVSSSSYLNVAPASPFIVPMGRARVIFVVKKVKWGKDKREKQKRWPRVRPSSSLSGVSSLPYSVETSWTSSFWHLHPLVQCAATMPCPVCFCAVEDGRCVRSDLRREGVRWYSCHYPHRCRGMDVVVVE